MFIRSVPREEADGPVLEIYEDDEARAGYLPTYTQLFSHHPVAYKAWIDLISAIQNGMDRRRCELATLAAAQTLKSTNCSIAHGKILRDRFYETDQVIEIAVDRHESDLDEADVAIMDFAERVAEDPTKVTRSDVEHLRSLGLTDRDILDVVLCVAARSFFATVVESLGAPPEEPMVEALEPELLEVLTVGRPLHSH